MQAHRKSKFESTCQAHDVRWVDPTFERLQRWQIVAIDIEKRRCGLRIVSV